MPTSPRTSGSRKPIWGRVMPELTMTEAAATKSASTSAAGAAVLSVHNLEAWYGEAQILHGMDFNVNAGEVVPLLGRNGDGQTPTPKPAIETYLTLTSLNRFPTHSITPPPSH